MKKIFTVTFMLSFCLILSAQDVPLHRQYKTQEANKNLLEKFAEYSQKHIEIQQFLYNYRSGAVTDQRTIPVIFHVIYHDEEQRISEEQIYSQLDALNRDFSQELRTIGHAAEQAEGFADKQADDSNIRFCLGQAMVGGSMRDGINYVKTRKEVWSHDDGIKYKRGGGANAFRPKQFLNVWIGKLEDGNSGYAQFPGAPDKTDGIVIDYRYFGTVGTVQPPYDEGKTLTHLIANYLGVPDIWNEKIYCGDDGVFDTPIHNGPNYGCPGYKHISICNSNLVEMTMNLMDNTDDACMYMFTYGQVRIMNAILSSKGPRNRLIKGTSECSSSYSETIAEQMESREDEVMDSDEELLEVNIIPNPATDYVTISLSSLEHVSNIAIYNILGEEVFRNSSNKNLQGSGNLELDTSSWSDGVYLVVVKSNAQNITKKFIISRF